MTNSKFLLKIKYFFLAILLWQLISVGLLSVGVWTFDVALVNTVLLALAIAVVSKLDALRLFLLSLPFMIVLPNVAIANLPMWRVLLIWLFGMVLLKAIYQNYQRKIGLKKFIVQFWQQNLASWDKWLIILAIFAAMSVVLSVFISHGAKQIIFLINCYLLYLTVLLVVQTEQEKSKFQNALLYSLLITVGLGYLQYLLTFYFSTYYFWQYWAVMISGIYYGQPLGEVLTYSNSWFSAGGSGQALRMFGIMQDTHSFGVVVMLALALWIGIQTKLANSTDKIMKLLKSQTREFWLVFVLLAFAIIACGTRGIWVAMLVPLVVTAWMWLRRPQWRKLVALSSLSYLTVIVLFVISPWISYGLNLIRTIDSDDNFIERAQSIYDLEEASNVGRLEIWQESIKYAATHPFGTGYGNFIVSLVESIPENTTYEQVASLEDTRYNLPQKFITAHSLYLHILVELGIIGLILFFVVWLLIAYAIYQKIAATNFELSRTNFLAVSLGLVLLWLLAYGIFDVTILNERVLLYLMSVLACLNLIIPRTALANNGILIKNRK